MAVLSPPSARVETAAGVAISGGKLRVYNVNTTTLSSLYSDEALATPLTNPVVADANGFLPSIFAEESTYDIAYLDASNVVLTGQSYNDFPTYQAGAADSIERTLSGARIDIDGGDIGSGQTGVRIQAGSPSPDDTGGYMRLGGWDGTQADEIWIDGAEVNVVEPKSLKEDEKRLTGVLFFDVVSVAGVTELDISLPNDPPGIRQWKIRVWDLYFSSAVASVNVRLSYDGTTYKSGASDYSFAFGTPIGGSSTTDSAHTSIQLQATSPSDANNPWIIDLNVLTPDSGTAVTQVWGRLFQNNAGAGAPALVLFEGCGLGAYGRALKLRLFPSTGTMTCRVSGEEIRGTGE
jgi:hypothetical protein